MFLTPEFLHRRPISKAVALREAQGNPDNIRLAKWAIARGYRATGKLADAEDIQLKLVAETEKAGEPEGYRLVRRGETSPCDSDISATAAPPIESASSTSGICSANSVGR